MAKVSGGSIRAGRAFVELFADDTYLVQGLRRAEARIRKFGTNIHNIGRKLGTLGLALSIPFAGSIKTFAQFDDTMRAVKAVTGSAGDEFEKLTKKAKYLGRTTSFTTNQVAECMLQLGRAGFSSTEIDQSIASILNLSRATRTDLSESARIASAALRAFDLPASHMTRVCDVMTAAANGSSQTLEDLGFSFSYCAPIAAQFGMTIEETAKIIGALSNFGIKASQAGTTFRRVLVNLADKRVQRRLKGFGIDVSNKETGEMRNASDILLDLGKAMAGMNPDKQIALYKELFGVWAMAGGAKLTLDKAEEFKRLYEGVDKAAGLAKATAKEMDAGIGGSFRMLWSACETVAITIGETLAPAVQRVADFWTRATSGLVVYIENNRTLIKQMAKLVLIILGVGAALVGIGVGMLLVSKLLVILASTLSTVLTLLFLPFNLFVRLLNLILFAGAAVISVFAGVAKAVGSVVMVFATIGKTILSVLLGVGSIVFSLLLGIGKALVSLAFGLIGAVGMILKGIVILVGTLTPLIGGIVLLLGKIVVGLTMGLVAGIGMIGSVIASLFPIIVSGLSAIMSVVSFAATVIAAGFSAAFAAISIVIKAAFIKVGAAILTGLSTVFSAIGAVLSSVFVPILSVVGSFLSAFVGMIASAVVAVGTAIGSVLAAVGAWISAAVTTAVTFIVVKFATVVGMTAAFIGHLIAALGSMIAGVLAAMSPIIVVLLTIAAAAGAVYLLISALGSVGRMIGDAFMQVVQVIGNCLSWIFSAVVGIAGRIVLGLVDCLGAVLTAAWDMIQTLGGIIAGAIGSVVEGIRSAFASAWEGVVSLFQSVFSTLGDIITAFGNFFMGVFDQIGTAVDWVREKFGILCNYAQETYGAVVAALSRGDIEAAIGVIWATIKLVWVQGSTFLLKTWYWVVETLQTAWATCVFKISEVLTKAWYGVQEFWTDTVYTMQTLWIEFSSRIVSAWKTAEKAIAKGIGYLIAKMKGLDPAEMAKTIEEDYNREARQRESEKSAKLTEVQNKRDTKMASLESEKEGTLDILRSDFDRQAGERAGQYSGKIAAQEQELVAAKEAYWAAIDRAKNPPPVAAEEEQEILPEKIKKKIGEIMEGFNASVGDKVSVTGSFSASAIQAMGVGGGPMDRVARATEKSEKHLEKIANKEEKKEKDGKEDKKKDEQAVFEGDDPAAHELKIQTRLLRDIAQGGRAFA